MPLCLNDIDSFFIGVIIHPFVKWVISTIVTGIIAICVSAISSRRTIFQSKKTEYISKLYKMLYSYGISYCHKKKKNIFRSKYKTNDFLEVEGELNTFLMSLSKTPEKLSELAGVFSFMLYNTKTLGYYTDYEHTARDNEEGLPLYYKNEGFYCEGCKQEKCKNRGRGGVLFDNDYGTKYHNNKRTLDSMLPADLVPEIHKTIDYCNNNIKPDSLWIILGVRRKQKK